MNKGIATYPNPTDFKDELPGIEMESINNIENKLLLPDSEEDMNDLAEATTDNVDKGGINDNIPINTQKIIKEEAEIQDTNETESGDTLAINDNQNVLTNEEGQV